MNKTLTINLSGVVFHIDENAYDVFNAYIDSIRRHFASSEGKDEIMQDIEARIAEMFQQRVGESKQVITLRDVEEVTAAMGKPEQFGDEESAFAGEDVPLQPGVKRRLFRSPDDEVIGGVCSGIGAYFGIDPVWLRLAFVLGVIFFGTGILLYIILWIVIPEAKTTADKLMMRGEQVTISNIEKNVREEVEGLKKRAGEFGDRVNQKFSDYSGFKGFLRRFFDALGELLGFIFKILAKLFAVLFIIVGLLVFGSLLFALIMVAGLSAIKFPPITVPVLLAALLLIGIPFLWIFYYGFKMLFNIKTNSRIINMTAGGLWLAGLVIGIITTVLAVRNYSEEGSTRQELNLIQPANDTLAVTMKNDISDADDEDINIFSGWSFDSRDTAVTVAGPVKVDIRRSSSDKFELIKVVESRGSSRRNAAENANGVKLTFAQTDNKLTLENHFQLTKSTTFAFQNVKYVIGVPLGKTIYLSASMRNFLYDVQNTGDIYDYDMAPHYWKMTEKGLECTDCTGEERSVGGNGTIKSGGINIGNDDLDSVVVNEHGVVIKKKGQDVIRIDEKGVLIKSDDKKENK